MIANDPNEAFTRTLLSVVIRDVRKLFPEITHPLGHTGVTTTRIGSKRHYCVELSSPGRPLFVWSDTAWNANEARAKAWQAFIRKYGPPEEEEAQA